MQRNCPCAAEPAKLSRRASRRRQPSSGTMACSKATPSARITAKWPSSGIMAPPSNRHPREGGDPVFPVSSRNPKLDSRLRGNDEVVVERFFRASRVRSSGDRLERRAGMLAVDLAHRLGDVGGHVVLVVLGQDGAGDEDVLRVHMAGGDDALPFAE